MKSRAFRTLAVLIVAALGGLWTGCASEPAVTADLVLKNGKVVVLDDASSEAQAIAVKDGRILSVGSNTDIDPHVGSSTQVIDLQGRLAIPGFIEGHGHFMGIGNAKMILDLTKPKNWDEVVAMVQEAVSKAQPGDWIRGRGWHQDKWDKTPEPSVEGLPVHNSLSAVSPDNPVVLTHASGHASFVNAKAMEVAGIDSSTADPPGGQILKDRRNRPTGFLRETAQRLVNRAADAPSPEEREQRSRRMAELAAQECVSNGVTSFQDAGSGFATIAFLKKLVDEGKMPLRLWMMVRASNEQLAERMAAERVIGYGDDRLTVRAVKLSIDGALGARGAWLLEPYSDAPELTGLNLIPLDSVRETARLCMENDYQLGIHAIGDRGNREVLDIYQKSFAANTGDADVRWRIEHAQHLNPDDIPRFAALKVIASMQGVHATSDGPWVPARLGAKRAEEGAYKWKTLMTSGAVVTNGTDAPVENVSPIASYYSTVSRKLSDGTRFYPDEKLSREEALRTYTINAAYAAFEEDIKGTLEVGKLADITVLSQDILTIAEDDIPATQVIFTIVGGKVVYRSDELASN